MENALLVGLSEQAALRRHMDIIANNLANLSTSGFKSEKPIFQDFIMPTAAVDGFTGEAGEIHYVQDTSLFRDFKEGPLNQTGNSLDWAINGDGWFVLEGPDGEVFTRNGHFRVDQDGQVVTGDGLPVLTDNGPLVLAPGDTDLVVSSDGTITSALGEKGKLRVVEFEDETRLNKQAAAVYEAGDDQEPLPATDYRVVQGSLEGSNVNAVAEISDMIAVTRAYTSASEILSSANTLRQSAIEKLGQVS